MAWTISNNYLSESQMQGNAYEVWKYFSAKGWTLNAIGGILGNMEKESNINPGLWQWRIRTCPVDTGYKLHRLGELKRVRYHGS